ncbi:MAG: DNA polymerase III subunit gamma/tau [Ruminococcus sp.]|nr:DNA polymerase III subunit gamma/tau [Ruminococcus sp.]MBR1753189.1 DNA polymerase III subunit gamma/tau [Ruminococcus sp.]
MLFVYERVRDTYRALYRKWRPMSFDDVVSQPHVTKTLINQIKNEKTAHAYLFTGSRGTGKTTCARIFAKAINCLNPKDGEPCLECEICKNADNGSLSDIFEMDAASNSKVDDIRELREGVIYTPEMCKYKVYIIDEVHMLSPGAFNALLKTMEEPPEHVKFVLATTEIHKVPATIVSRCQHFDFHRIRTEDIVARLEYIASKEQLSLDNDAAVLIARLSDGGMRDALSLLDQCAAFSDKIDTAVVSNAAGIAGRDHLFDMIEKISARDAAGAIKTINELYSMSKDLKVLCSELIEQLRNVMLIKSVDGANELISCMPDEIDRLKKIADSISLDFVLECLTVLQDCLDRFRGAASKRTEFEMCIIRLCTNPPHQHSSPAQTGISSSEVSALLARIAELEKRTATGGIAAAVQNTPVTPMPKPKPQKPLKKFDINNYTPLAEWQDILEKLREQYPGIAAFLENSAAAIEGDTFNIICENDFYIQKVKASNDTAKLKQVIHDYYGKDFGFKLYAASSVDIKDKENPINVLKERAKSLGVDVEIKK